MTDTWTILQHVEWEGPGLIAAEAQGRGLHTDIRRLDLGAGLPQPDDVGGLVVMGGPMGAYETDKHPFLAEECALIAELVRRSRPVLGVCLGAQLLAQALGARGFPGPGPEIGFGFVDLTAAGGQDPLFGSIGPSVPVAPTNRCVERACPFPGIIDGRCRAHAEDLRSERSLLPSTTRAAIANLDMLVAL